jgi:putative ABC transport system permease protein
VAALARFGPADLPRLQMVAIDLRVLAGSAAATLGSAVLFGLAPSLRLARTGVVDTLKDSGRTVAGSAHQRMRRALAAVQVALAFVLVVSGGLLLRSFVAMLSASPGFEPRGAITATVDLPPARYSTPAAATAFFQRAAERIQGLPGVRAVSFGSDLPWTGYDENTSFDIIGRKFPDREGPEARYHFITAGYPPAVGTAIIAGRDFSPSDAATSPKVVLLNESAARKYWTTPDAAVGARLDLWGEERTVAGVIGDVRDVPWHDRAAPALYFPQPQTWQFGAMFLVVRSAVPPESLVADLRRVIGELDPELPLANVRPLDSVAGAAMATRRLTLGLVATFGLTALVLAIVGIYGVMAQAVGQRQHEFGVRQALGATRGDIMRLVFSSGALITAAGLAAGLALGAAATRQLAAMLYGVTPLDPVTFTAVAAVLALAAGAAAYLPARRATRISAAASLRAFE